MNFEEEGLGFARIVKTKEPSSGSKSKKKRNEKILSVHPEPEEEGIESFDEFTVSPGEKIQHIPVREKERSVLYVCGQSGSGKSFYSNKYIEEYKHSYPKRSIYLFSVHKDDPSLKCKSIKKINLDDKFISTALTLDDFKDCLVLFDDVDVLKKGPLKAKLQHILHTLLETGRHANCSVIYISHIACKSHETRVILNEANFIVVFPKNMSAQAFKYLFNNYVGLSPVQQKRVKNMKGRAVTYYKSYPNLIFNDKEAWIVKDY
jgi:Cdc6-like AAA superfamily ATPase